MSLIYGLRKIRTDQMVETAIAVGEITENSEVINEICEFIFLHSQYVKSMLSSLKKKLNDDDTQVVMLALSLLDKLWSNGGSHFRRGVSSKKFIPKIKSACRSNSEQICLTSRKLVEKWAENEVKNDESLGRIRILDNACNHPEQKIGALGVAKNEIAQLENTVSRLEEDKKELEATVARQDKKIAELEKKYMNVLMMVSKK